MKIRILGACYEKIVANNPELLYKLIEKLCLILPSYHEEKRAEYCIARLEEWGAEWVYTDDAFNAIYPVNCESRMDVLRHLSLRL